MTEQELNEMERNADYWPNGNRVRALVAEVRRLNTLIQEGDWQGDFDTRITATPPATRKAWRDRQPGCPPYRIHERLQDGWEPVGSLTFPTLEAARRECEKLQAGPLGKSSMFYVIDCVGVYINVLTVSGWEGETPNG